LAQRQNKKGFKVITFAFSFFFPFLLVMAAVQYAARLLGKNTCDLPLTLILGIPSALIVVIPLGGLSLARWLISINANFSIPLTAILLSKVWENASHIKLLDGKAFLSSWIFGLTVGLVLYPMALGLGRFDPYEFGWSFSLLFVLLMTVTVMLLFLKNRFGVILVACILAYDLELLESKNLWEYLVDPFFVLISGAALNRRLIRKIRSRNNDNP
jgi:hypothetical protein